ncbi:PH domain-containing protein [Stenotrophomonas maltophilia]|uniref:PH domain-containing protein n=1 Tax=Stenotrophomonas maltophilia TaxID=40324 RepID=A0AA40XY16_STEMA|nr:PH domain-containing protein [Stenotrophomonas maltophilia]
MGYIDNNLVGSEKVLMIAKIHWGVYVGGIAWATIGFLLIVGDAGGAGFLALLIGALLLLRAFIYAASTELAITDRRVIAKFGLVRRQTVELLHSKVEGLTVNQTILGRILDFGTIVVNGTGSGRTPIRGISKPLEFRRTALAEIDSRE